MKTVIYRCYQAKNAVNAAFVTNRIKYYTKLGWTLDECRKQAHVDLNIEKEKS